MTDILVELRVGSHLYGTATATSDVDLKVVYLPAARDILLQRARPTLTDGPAKDPGTRNAVGDTDRESFSLQRFLDLALAGQPLALEMLFAPNWAFTRPPEPLWREVQALAPRFVSRQASAFLRYCRKQAALYGSKGARAAAARQALGPLQDMEAVRGSGAKLSSVEDELAALVGATPLTGLIDLPIGDGRMVRHLDVCGRRVPIHATVKAAREMAARLLAEYGARALRAGQDGGVDWKALSHAVRVGREAVELLTTGRLRFPLAGAPHLLAIKTAQIPYDDVAAEIENLLREVEAAAVTSRLPEQPDHEAAEALVLRAYRERVLAG